MFNWFIVANGLNKDCLLISDGVHRQEFNNENELINSKGEPYIVVHQYDKRWDEFKDSVNKLKKELDVN